MNRPKMLVIGSTNIDMVVHVPELPQPGQTVLGGSFRMTPGGKGANQAVAAARAGGAVTFVSAVGDDAFGIDNRKRFEHDGIDISHLYTKPGLPTGVALIMVDAQGENIISVAPGANAQLSEDDLIKASPIFHGAQVVLLQLEIPLASVIWAATFASRLGCRVVLNPAPMPPDGLPDELLQCVDLLTPNEGELRALAPGAATLEEAASAVLSRGPKAIVVTQGAQGATIVTTEGARQIPAFPVDPIDTVGAGDCFTATLGVALAGGKALDDAVRFAAAAAALSTTVSGAQESMPTHEMIDEYLASVTLR